MISYNGHVQYCKGLNRSRGQSGITCTSDSIDHRGQDLEKTYAEHANAKNEKRGGLLRPPSAAAPFVVLKIGMFSIGFLKVLPPTMTWVTGTRNPALPPTSIESLTVKQVAEYKVRLSLPEGVVLAAWAAVV